MLKTGQLWQAMIDARAKWGLVFSIGITVLYLTIVMNQNANIRNENEAIKAVNETIKADHAKLEDRFDTRDMKELVGMKETAKKLETAYLAHMNREAQMVEYIRQNPCRSLPVELAVALPAINYTPPEAILRGFTEKGDQ